jgi:hypothetical protein
VLVDWLSLDFILAARSHAALSQLKRHHRAVLDLFTGWGDGPNIPPVFAVRIHESAHLSPRHAPGPLDLALSLRERIRLWPSRNARFLGFIDTVDAEGVVVRFKNPFVVVEIIPALAEQEHSLVRPRRSVLDRLWLRGLAQTISPRQHQPRLCNSRASRQGIPANWSYW